MMGLHIPRTLAEKLNADKRYPRLRKRAEMPKRERPLGHAAMLAIVKGEGK